MSEIKSGRFSIKVDRATSSTQTGTNGKTSEVIVYKGLNLLTPVNVTPSENQYRVTLSCTGCTAELKNDYKTIYVKNVTASSAKIDVTINVENKINYKKTISVEKVISENEISNMKSNITAIEQKADSISLRVEQTEENLSNNYPTYSNMNSAIDMKANSITSTVSKLYATKDDFNHLNIGSRNMLLKTSDYKTLSCNGTENQSFFLYNISDPSLLAGKTATLTFTYKVKDWNGQGGFTPQTGDSNWVWFNQFWLWSEGKFEYSATTSFPSNFNDTKFYIRSDWIYGTIEVTEARLVISDKKADWSPAPEDIENRISSAESKLTKDSLTTTIGSYYTTSADVNGLITSKGYATTSQVTQTATDLTAKFTSAGGINLIRNSTGIGGTNGWQGNIIYDENDSVGKITGNRRFFYINNKNTTENYAFSPRFALKANTTYTLSCWAYRNNTSTGYDIFVLSSNTKPWTDTGTSYDNIHHLHNGSSTGWERIVKTFTTGANEISGYVRIDNNGYTGSGDANVANIHFASLMLNEGSVAHPWTPHPSECYNGITQIDSQGIKVYHNSIDSNSYTHMSPSGFFIRYKGEDIFICNENGLSYKGTITGSTINGGTIKGTEVTGGSLNVEGTLTANRIVCEDIDSPKYPGVVTEDLWLYVSTSGNDDSELESGATFQTFDGLLDKLPKNLNGHDVRIEMLTNITENVKFKGFHGGKIGIYMKGHALYGYVASEMGSARINIYSGHIGNATDESNGWGKIHPSKGYAVSTYTTTVSCADSGAIGLYNIDIYGADKYLSGSSTKLGVASQDFGAVYLNGTSYYGCDIGARANVGGRIHDVLSYNVCTKYGFYATSGGYITLAGNSHAGGKTDNYKEKDGGKVIVGGGATFVGGEVSTPGSSAPVVTTKTVTVKSTSGDTYRSSIYNSWKKDNTVRQGDYGYGDCNGIWLFGDQFEQFKGKNITKVVITISRQEGGQYASVDLNIKTHNYKSRPSGKPSYAGTVGTLGLAVNTSGKKTITDTNNAIITGLKAGTIKGIGLQSTYDSNHYAVCSGSVTVKITYTE